MSKKSQRSDVIAQLSAQLGTFSTSERRIADYIISNGNAVTGMTVRELADATETSPASVSRFARTLGYGSYSDFRFAMAITVGNADPKQFGGDKVSLDDVPGSFGFILQEKIAELTETTEQLNAAEFKNVVQQMREASNVFICAVGNSITIAENASFKFCQVGIRAWCPPTAESAISASLNLKGSDLVLMMSTSGRSRRLSVIADNAEDAGTPIVLLTNNPESPLALRADIVLRAVSRDAMFSEGIRFSQNSLNYVVELLYLFLITGWEDTVERTKLLNKKVGEDRQL
mgnify:FL=1